MNVRRRDLALLVYSLFLLLIAGPANIARAADPPVDINIVAHEDDDILFMNPDILDALVAGRRQVTVFVTSGNLKADDAWYVNARESGAMHGYAEMAKIAGHIRAGSRRCNLAVEKKCPDYEGNAGKLLWTTGQEKFGRFRIQYAKAVDEPIELLFLRLDAAASVLGDPVDRTVTNDRVTPHPTLKDLWHNAAPVIEMADGSGNYTRDGVLDVLVQILGKYTPAVVRTQDNTDPPLIPGVPADGNHRWNDPGCAEQGGIWDHADHYYSAVFTQQALGMYVASPLSPARPQYYIYNGYNITCHPQTTQLDAFSATYKQYIFFYYSIDDRPTFPGSCALYTNCYPGGSSYAPVMSLPVFNYWADPAGGQIVPTSKRAYLNLTFRQLRRAGTIPIVISRQTFEDLRAPRPESRY